MATIYVRTSGNDTTGNGSTGAPFATLNKALSVVLAGDLILVGDGTYAENSGSGFLQINKSLASLTRIAPESGLPDRVTVKGTGTSYGTVIANATNLWFDQITFQAQADTSPAALRFANGTVAGLTFTRCKFIAYSSGSVTNLCVSTGWTNSTTSINELTFTECVFDQIGTGLVAAMNLSNQHADAVAQGIEVFGCDFRTSGRGVQLQGVTDVRVLDNTADAWHPGTAATAFQLGVDGESGLLCSGIVAGNTFRSHLGHAAVIGAGCDGVLVVGNRVYGGKDASVGQGLVVKEAKNARLEKNTVTSGGLSGIYFKAAVDCQAFDNVVHNRYATSSALRVEYNNANARPNQRLTVRRNYLAAAVGSAVFWGNATHDSGGSVCDENVYVPRGAATLGTIRGTAVTKLSELRTAWGGYDRPSNDRNSRIGQTRAVYAGVPVMDLPA